MSNPFKTFSAEDVPRRQMARSSTIEGRRTIIEEKRRLSLTLAGGVCVLLAAFFASDIPAWEWMSEAWIKNPDNSHGILVPAFSLWLLWIRRDRLTSFQPRIPWTAIVLGSGLIVAGIGIRCAGIYTRTISMQAISVLPCIAGIVFCCGGFVAARWAWPAVLFLIFMIPLPAPIGGLLSNALQKIATLGSTYILQTIGIPAVSEGNIIWLTEHSLGVAQACSGLRMLMSFFALAVGVSFMIDRAWWQKCIIIASAPAIAVIANILRISGTAIAYEFGNEKMAEMIFHDLAGWLMMPLGLMLLWLELFVLSRLFNDAEQRNEAEQRNMGFGSLK